MVHGNPAIFPSCCDQQVIPNVAPNAGEEMWYHEQLKHESKHTDE